jgi:hypothetical protein
MEVSGLLWLGIFLLGIGAGAVIGYFSVEPKDCLKTVFIDAKNMENNLNQMCRNITGHTDAVYVQTDLGSYCRYIDEVKKK